MREYKITEDCIIYNDMPRGWAKGKTQPIWHRKVYTMWYNMWARCYKFEGHNSKYYFDCEVDNTFRYLSNFLKWIEQQPHFEDFCLTCSNTMWGVDKDFIKQDNKIYTPSLIRLCTQRDNSLERISRKGSPMLNKSVSDKSKKPLIALPIMDDVILVFNSFKETSLKGFSRSKISECCNGKKESYRGYTWRYLTIKVL